MSNKDEFEKVRKKIQGLDKELDTFIQAVREIKEIRNAAGTLPDDLERNKSEIEAQKKEFEALVASVNDQLVNFEQRAREAMSDLEKKSDAIVDEAGAKISALLGEKEGSIQERTGERNKTGNITKEIDKRIKGVEEKIFKALSRQQYIIVIMAVLFIAGMGFFSYLFFMQ
ncbi:hypothetical protein BMS3Abin09_00606 [bacterium BMS3Abin09]|nr:hypothetical protein BMS3Abin09_00606 [bacterium BMS3Abin09]GBE40974.1 hypothetical protein BMS3Bbin09_00862 [bacterium BMS3Bbin09]